MEIILTTCCKEKNDSEKLLPAYVRYTHPRIHKVLNISQHQNKELFFLSGKFGLIHKDTPIPWYDQILSDNDVPVVTNLTIIQLNNYLISNVIFYAYPRATQGWENYYQVIESSCKYNGIKLTSLIVK